jgi:N-acyl-D-aspartate/D-glutamate deacylase
MPVCDTLIRNVLVLDGSSAEPRRGDVAMVDGKIAEIGDLARYSAASSIEGKGRILAPGFVDVHTHDDLYLLRSPQMLPKLSQGVTTVIVGNCGISAAPVTLEKAFPDPMNLLGEADAFRYPTFRDYVKAIEAVKPAVNVAALVGHTSLRNNHMDRLDREASGSEIAAMRAQLREALDHGALGLSTGLAYLSANSASSEEVMEMAEPLKEAQAIYTTHLRSETNSVLDAMQEAFRIGAHAKVPIVISHLKCAGVDNWGRSAELLTSLETARRHQPAVCDCYPYSASSSTLDLRQVDERVNITITWSDLHPEVAGKSLAKIADDWGLSQLEAARRLQPAGAIYHCISEDDMRAILRHPATMIGSDGLPNDPRPHPRLWGTFPRVLGRYAREEKLFSLAEAVRKMTSLPAERFKLHHRGKVQEGYCADLVLFDAESVADTATYSDPVRAAAGIDAVWVNGILSYQNGKAGERGGRFLIRSNA